MKKKNKAWEALDSFYQHAFNTLRDFNDLVGFFVSDCGIVYVDNNIEDKKMNLKCLLKALKIINENVLDDGFMLTCSIAYGKFEYHEKFVFDRMRKSAFQGNAYLDAYLDNENGLPKIRPGQTRLILSDDLVNELGLNNSIDETFKFLKKSRKHYYFYWMINNHSRINGIDKEYNEIYKSKYDLIKSLLKKETYL